MLKFQKRMKDRKTIESYEKRLRNQRAEYAQAFSAISETGRKNRALAIGECCLQAMEKLSELINKQPPVEYVKGSLYWNLNEQRVKDESGEKGFKYTVVFHVQSYEPAWTEEEIRQKVAEAERRIKKETDEMYSRDESNG